MARGGSSPPGAPEHAVVGERRPTGARARARWAVLILPPLAGLLFAESLLFVAALLDGRARYFLSPAHWSRSDSRIYLKIAAHGYSLFQCSGPVYPPHSWCGTAGWAPLYPWLMSVLGHLGFTLPAAGMVLAIVCTYLTLQAIWVLIGPSWSFSPLCCLAFAACFPGMVYDYAIFPVSLQTFLSVVSITLFIRRRYLFSGLVGALCSWAFATGPLIAVVLLVAAFVVDRGRDLWRVVARSAGVALAGFGALLLAYQWWVGDWSAYFKTAAKYGNGVHDPVATFVTAFTGGSPATYSLQDPNSGYHYLIPRLQTAFVAALVIGLVLWAVRRRPVGRAGSVILVYTVVVWLVPLVAGPSLSRYRMEALLAPCAALCTRLPRPVLVALVVVSAVLAVGLTSLFTQRLIA